MIAHARHEEDRNQTEDIADKKNKSYLQSHRNESKDIRIEKVTYWLSKSVRFLWFDHIYIY